jgi:undecaprenyl pyrophosphate phosphatase UppP
MGKHTETSQESLPYDALVQKHLLDREKRATRHRRFRLRTLFWFVAQAGILFAILHYFGADILAHLRTRIQETWGYLPMTAAVNVVALPCLMFGVLIGVSVCWFACRTRSSRGFMLFAAMSCIGLLALTVAMSLDVRSLHDTELRELSVAQIVRIVLLLLGCVLPVSSGLGWYLGSLDQSRE